MTDREKAIVMAYTGACMLTGDKFQIFHKYIEDLMGRPVYTHELAFKAIENEIKEKAKADFIKLCEDQEPKRGICSKIIMDIIQLREDLNYDSGDYDVDMVHEAMRDAFNIALDVIDQRITESEVLK